MDYIYLSYAFLGMGTLFPWNTYLTAIDYYVERYPNVQNIDRWITIAYLPTNLVATAFFIRFHTLIQSKLRIIAGFFTFTISVSMMPILDLIQSSNAFFTMTLIVVTFCGIADGSAQGALFGEAASLHPRYTQALVAGTAISGVVVSFLRIFTKALLPHATKLGMRISADVYFLICALICGSCIFLYSTVLPRLQMNSAISSSRAWRVLNSNDEYIDNENSSSSSSNNNTLHNNRAAPLPDSELSRGIESSHPHRSQNSEISSNEATPIENYHHQHNSSRSSSNKNTGITISDQPLDFQFTYNYLDIAWHVRHYIFSLLLIYIVTLSIYPGVLVEDIAHSQLSSWYPVVLIAIFNVADCGGKWLPAWNRCRIEDYRVVLGGSAMRILFIPAFHVATTHNAGPLTVIVLTALLGVSNGWLTSAAMVQAPTTIDAGAASLCGNIMVFSLISGLCLGAICGFLWLL